MLGSVCAIEAWCFAWTRSISRLKLATREAGLANDGLQCTHSEFIVVRYWHSDRRAGKRFLHDDMTAALAHFDKTVSGQDGARLLAGEDAQPTQWRHPPA